MQDVNFKRSVYAALILILLECFLLMNKTQAQQQPGATTNIDEQTATISKVIGSAEIQKAIKRCKGKSIVISFFPLLTKVGRKNELSVEVVYQCEGEKSIPPGYTTMLKTFRAKAAAYVKYLKKNDVKKEIIPYCYYIQITPEEAKNLAAVAVTLNPLTSDFRASNLFPCDPFADNYRSNKNSQDSCNCNVQPFFLVASTIPPGKCPPGCQITKVGQLNNMVQQAIKEEYRK